MIKKKWTIYEICNIGNQKTGLFEIDRERFATHWPARETTKPHGLRGYAEKGAGYLIVRNLPYSLRIFSMSIL